MATWILDVEGHALAVQQCDPLSHQSAFSMCSKITLVFGVLPAVSLLLTTLSCSSAHVMFLMLQGDGCFSVGDGGALPINWSCCGNGTGPVVEATLWQVLSHLCLVCPQCRQGCSDTSTSGCHLLPSGLPQSCSNAHSHARPWFQMCCQNIMYNIIAIKDLSSYSCIRLFNMEIEVQGQAHGASKELLRHPGRWQWHHQGKDLSKWRWWAWCLHAALWEAPLGTADRATCFQKLLLALHGKSEPPPSSERLIHHW